VPGVYKISSGVNAGAQNTFPILLPTGYIAYELTINDLYPGSAQALIMRFSYDNGATYPTTGYVWGYDQVTTAASSGWSQQGATGSGAIVIFGTPVGTPNRISAGSFKFYIPRVAADIVQGVDWHGYHWTGASGTYNNIRGAGRYLGLAGPATAIRFERNDGGTFAWGDWQLNGIK